MVYLSGIHWCHFIEASEYVHPCMKIFGGMIHELEPPYVALACTLLMTFELSTKLNIHDFKLPIFILHEFLAMCNV